MATTDTSTVLRRMLAQTPTQTASGVPAAFKPLTALIEKLADRSLSLPLTVVSVTQKAVTREGVAQSFEPPALMLRLVAKTGATGMAGLCSHLRAALIEVQTTGKVASTAPSNRAATDADTAICSGFVSDLLLQANTALDADTKAVWDNAFAPRGHFPGARAVALALDDVPLSEVTLTLDLGNGARQGTLTLLLPQNGKAAASKAGQTWKAGLSRAVNDAPVALTAVLHRLVLPLSRIEELRVGDTLTLPRMAAGAIMLEASETSVGPFKLGQISGQKALRRVMDAAPMQEPLSPAPALTQPDLPDASDVADGSNFARD